MNPIAPYRWEARYDTGRLAQCDVDGWHTSREIDRGRLRALVLLGHPDSPITLPLPRPPAPLGPPPDEVLVRATTDLRMTLADGARALTVHRWTFLGLRYGARAWIVQIDPAGHYAAISLALPAGAAIDPMPCGRC